MKLRDIKILVTGDRCWGKGDTIAEALANASLAAGKKQTKYFVYLAHPDTTVDDMGDFGFPSSKDHEFQPREIHRVGDR
jgi:hypothetical protein